MAQRGKRYLELVKLIDHEKKYTVDEAVHLLKETAKANFDQTIEIHFRLGIDSRHADQQVRASATLPSGSGKNVRILVFAQGDGERAAREARCGLRGCGRPDQADRGRLARFRCRARHAGHDGQGRSPRPRARSPGPDAEPALRHHRDAGGPAPRHQRAARRSRGLPQRPHEPDPHPDWQDEFQRGADQGEPPLRH